MGHGANAFKEADVRRAVRAVVAAGQPVQGVRFEGDGTFTVLVGKPIEPSTNEDALNEWDQKYGQAPT
jgi:hypothetical protein